MRTIVNTITINTVTAINTVTNLRTISQRAAKTTIHAALALLATVSIAACSSSSSSTPPTTASAVVPNAPTNVSAVAAESQVTISWDSVTGRY